MPATLDEINRILESEEFDDADKEVVKWQFRMCGDFEQALWQAIIRADGSNLAKLSLGYPAHVAGFIRWSEGNLGTRLRKAGLSI